ncbi:MAG: chemotaxis protein CheA [Chloroflexi bacterium]|nr:chemotaxis protein CheA [Chloroflexota bacterium]MBU1747264.1 chemotaxis protein CheA [Chloroflexota bacterium]
MDLSQYQDLFISEVQEHLQALSQAILALEQQPTGDEAVERCFRAAHSIKGMAATMGYEEMSRLAHAAEDVLDQVRKHAVNVTPELVDLLFQALDGLQDQAQAIAHGHPTPAPTGPGLVAALQSFRPMPRAPVAPPALAPNCQVTVQIAANARLKDARALLVLKRLREVSTVVSCQPSEDEIGADTGTFDGAFTVVLYAADPARARQAAESVAEVQKVTVTPLAPTAPVQPTPASPPAWEELGLGQSVRVNVAHLDHLLRLVSELVVNKSRLWRVEERYDLPDLKSALEEHDRILAELQDGVLQARTVPVAQVFNRFPRMVRDLARQQGKLVELDIEGAEIELDRGILQELGDPLLHLLRNAIDHGLESPDQRQTAGKAPAGQIQLTAARQQDQIVITVQDDGQGMDPDHLRQIAIERGLITPGQAVELSDAEALRLICRPGFSTATQVTNVSGRGVGMDVVRRQVEALRGQLAIQSEPGHGSRFILRLPVTLAIIQALLVRVGAETFAIPLSHVQHTTEVPGETVREIQHQAVAALPQALLPLRPLATLLGLPTPDLSTHDDQEPFYALIIERGGLQLGLVVDELLGHKEIVVKSLTGMLGQIPGLAGATILGDGEVVLILDLNSLLALRARPGTRVGRPI